MLFGRTVLLADEHSNEITMIGVTEAHDGQLVIAALRRANNHRLNRIRMDVSTNSCLQSEEALCVGASVMLCEALRASQRKVLSVLHRTREIYAG